MPISANPSAYAVSNRLIHKNFTQSIVVIPPQINYNNTCLKKKLTRV